MRRVKLYAGFERFWHWTQSLLILFLAITGFEIHGTYELFGYENSVVWHQTAAWAFLVLIVFAVFWHFTTGAWRQYIPTADFIRSQMRYYISGIFRDEPHPVKKTAALKLNPLQKITYLGLKILIIPVQVVTGFLYLYFHYPETLGVSLDSLETVALIHTFGAFALIAFVIGHVYLTTTGTTPTSNIKAMITGWEEVEATQDELNREAMPEMVKSSEMGYYFLDKNGVIQDVNDAWVKLYGYNSPKDVIGKHSSITRKPEDLQALTDCLQIVLKGEKIESRKVIRLCKDGSTAEHILTANPVYFDKEIVGMAGFIVDVSKEKELA